MGFFKKLGDRWGVSSTKDLVLILLVFSLTGLTSLWFRGALKSVFGITEFTPWYGKVLYSIFVIVPIYYIFILIYAYILGQFHFFYGRVAKMFKRIGSMFKKKKD